MGDWGVWPGGRSRESYMEWERGDSVDWKARGHAGGGGGRRSEGVCVVLAGRADCVFEFTPTRSDGSVRQMISLGARSIVGWTSSSGALTPSPPCSSSRVLPMFTHPPTLCIRL